MDVPPYPTTRTSSLSVYLSISSYIYYMIENSSVIAMSDDAGPYDPKGRSLADTTQYTISCILQMGIFTGCS